MQRPIQVGDVCLVVDGLGGRKSPNIGLVVTVTAFKGESYRYGKVFTCTGKGVCQLTDSGTYVECNEADFAASWLHKLGDQPTKTVEKDEEIHA